ncbi:hypothetical protein ZWY2020_024757 [Hordeum vulgare]|nr:hypothetical protein ZWY2020_024757 [Hordeum vulgare]
MRTLPAPLSPLDGCWIVLTLAPPHACCSFAPFALGFLAHQLIYATLRSSWTQRPHGPSTPSRRAPVAACRASFASTYLRRLDARPRTSSLPALLGSSSKAPSRSNRCSSRIAPAGHCVGTPRASPLRASATASLVRGPTTQRLHSVCAGSTCSQDGCSRPAPRPRPPSQAPPHPACRLGAPSGCRFLLHRIRAGPAAPSAGSAQRLRALPPPALAGFPRGCPRSDSPRPAALPPPVALTMHPPASAPQLPCPAAR